MSASNPITRDAPKPPAEAKNLRADLSAVLAEFGHDADAMTLASVIAQGHTPDTLRAALSAA